MRSLSSQHWFVQRFPDQAAAARSGIRVASRRIASPGKLVGWAATARRTALGSAGLDVLCARLGRLEKVAIDAARKMTPTKTPEPLRTGRGDLETPDLMNLLSTVVDLEHPTHRLADPGTRVAGAANLVVGMASSAHPVSEVAD